MSSPDARQDQGTNSKLFVADGPCVECGSKLAKTWDAPDGPVRLCPSCGTLFGFGCP